MNTVHIAREYFKSLTDQQLGVLITSNTSIIDGFTKYSNSDTDNPEVTQFREELQAISHATIHALFPVTVETSTDEDNTNDLQN